jgi:hypothetical protein
MAPTPSGPCQARTLPPPRKTTAAGVLIAKLPGPAKGRWWSYLILGLVIFYFGFFFANFLTSQLTGNDLSFW